MGQSTDLPSTAYRWAAGSLTASKTGPDEGERPTVVDSWLVSGGRTLASGMHPQRFICGLPESARPGAEGFFAAAARVVPAIGQWFPRVQHGTESGFSLVVRPAPALSRSIVLATHDGVDPRTAPTVKGPDLVALLATREVARSRGADEPVILSPDGFVVEGATTSLLWWRGDTLCTPSADLPRMDGVTARAVLALAEVLGVEVSWGSTDRKSVV